MIEKLQKIKSDTRYALFQCLTNDKEPCIETLKDIIQYIDKHIEDAKND